jgi:hypothetical protein
MDGDSEREASANFIVSTFVKKMHQRLSGGSNETIFFSFSIVQASSRGSRAIDFSAGDSMGELGEEEDAGVFASSIFVFGLDGIIQILGEDEESCYVATFGCGGGRRGGFLIHIGSIY